MRAKDFIVEGNNTNLLIVDVQPSYSARTNDILPGIQNIIEKCNGGKIVIVYNNFGGADSDTEHVVSNYLAGIDDEENYYEEDDEWVHSRPNLVKNLQRATYLQKEYGFLRPFMDQGVCDSVIIEIIREMYQRQVSDSRDMEINTMSQRVQDEINSNNIGWDVEGISVQDWVPIATLKQLSPFYMVGGGRDECLREIELLCNAFNIRYKRVDKLIY